VAAQTLDATKTQIHLIKFAIKITGTMEESAALMPVDFALKRSVKLIA
jgi:hypothetical protein